jgi:hypothetical protein
MRSFAQVLAAGVHIAMNGQCFQWDRVRKNTRTGLWITVDTKAGLKARLYVSNLYGR